VIGPECFFSGGFVMLDCLSTMRIIRPAAVIALLSISSSLGVAGAGDWKPAAGPLMTRWAGEVSPDNVLPEYPRPQMVRRNWLNLNGLWDYAIRPKDAARPESFDGKILVPFAVESALSGVMKPVGPDNRLWYRRTFSLPASTIRRWAPDKKRILLHFGAVDWDATVWVNGNQVGNHRGGYDPFTFDITDAVETQDLASLHEIVVSVWDPTDAGTQPRGKQVRKPGSIWYTAVTGIWQTVWIEPASTTYIESMKILPDVDRQSVTLALLIQTPDGDIEVEAAIYDGGRKVGEGSVKISDVAPAEHPGYIAPRITLGLPDAKLWSPDTPFLYDVTLITTNRGEKTDEVRCYFAMRKISLGKDENGVLRLCLNNKPLFQYGPLDQGWWPDGLYTAPTDEALKYDIEVTKKLGMNTARKHVKVEPDRWYYWCDKLGLLVWQDMPSGDRYIGGDDPDITRSEESAKQYDTELTRIIDAYRNHPCIVMWVPFNEGWGQFDTARVVDMIRKLDPTRLVDNASGWTDRGVGDVHDVHSYPGPAAPPVEDKRAVVLGEFGGLGLPISGHTWQAEKNWGYRSFTSADALTDAYLALIERLRPLIGKGLSAAIYTQTTDVEIEVNGLMTYDRAMIKMDADNVRAANEKLYLPPPTVRTVVPSAQEEAVEWRYTTEKPGEDWFKPEFDAGAWKQGRGGFGTRGTPGAVVNTVWDTGDIWLRREVTLPEGTWDNLALSIHHDEDVDVYINGVQAATAIGYTTAYEMLPIRADAKAALKPGANLLAVHCHQTGGGQYIDAGLVQVIEQE
jgi:hypothetical protein